MVSGFGHSTSTCTPSGKSNDGGRWVEEQRMPERTGLRTACPFVGTHGPPQRRSRIASGEGAFSCLPGPAGRKPPVQWAHALHSRVPGYRATTRSNPALPHVARAASRRPVDEKRNPTSPDAIRGMKPRPFRAAPVAACSADALRSNRGRARATPDSGHRLAFRATPRRPRAEPQQAAQRHGTDPGRVNLHHPGFERSLAPDSRRRG